VVEGCICLSFVEIMVNNVEGASPCHRKYFSICVILLQLHEVFHGQIMFSLFRKFPQKWLIIKVLIECVIFYFISLYLPKAHEVLHADPHNLDITFS
jgi:hypothetical protein